MTYDKFVHFYNNHLIKLIYDGFIFVDSVNIFSLLF